MTPQDSAAEVEALVERVRVWVEYAADLSTELTRTRPDVLATLDSLAQQLEKLREERNSAIRECDLRAEESAAASRLLIDLRTHLVAAEAERDATLERVKMLQETLRLISDGCKLARDDLRPELARIEEVADRALALAALAADAEEEK